MKKILKWLLLVILAMTFKNNAMAATLEIMNGSCGDISHSYEFYKIFDIIGDGEEVAYQYQVTNKWKNFFSQEISQDLAILDENGIVTEFASGLNINPVAASALKYVEDNTISFDLKPIVACTAEDRIEIELDEGYYLIKSPRGNLGTLIEITTSSQIYEKNMEPVVLLYYDDNVVNKLKYASIGDTVEYTTEVIIFKGTSNAYFEIIGNPGITITPRDIQLIGGEFESSYLRDLVFKTTDLKNENAIVGMKLPDELLETTRYDIILKIRIIGKVNENILFSNNESTNVNDISLKLYYGDGKEVDTNASLMSWKYTINTFHTENTKALDVPNVHYSLSKINDTENPELFDFVKISEGVYRLALDGETNTTTNLVNTTGKNIVIEGLNIGNYYLLQTNRPAGFAKVYDSAEIKLEIADNTNGRKLKNDTLNIELAYDTVRLPMTGGSGTTLLITFGLVTFLLSLSLIITNIRKKNN